MATSDKILFRVDDSMKVDIEAHRVRNGYESTSEATRDLVEVGLRESKGPVLYHLRESANTAAFVLACGAISVLILGVTTDIFDVWNSMVIGAVFLIVGGSLVATIEVMRTINSQNELGWQLIGGKL